jgi:hypothetical protein
LGVRLFPQKKGKHKLRFRTFSVSKLRLFAKLAGMGFALLLLAISFVSPVKATDGFTLYEHLSTGQDGDSDKIYGANWGYMQFTADDISHTAAKLSLYLKRNGEPGTVTVLLREAEGGVPEGDDLLSITFNGDVISTSYTSYGLDISEEGLEAGEQYAIVVRAVAGDVDNYVYWGKDDGGGLANAISGTSVDGGLSFDADGDDDDFLFEVWGNPCIEVLGAKVFSGYKQTGDWLVVADVKNVYVPYYPNNDSQIYFQLQLLSGTTVKGATSFRAWDRQPLAIYLNAATAGTMTWGSAYKIRIQSMFDSDVHSEYTLVSADWNAGNLLYLDSYVRTLASIYEDYYDTVYLTSVTGQTDRVLNESGSIVFMRGVPGLEIVRTDLFYTSFGIETPEPTEHAILEPDTETAIGSENYNRLEEIADFLGGDVAPETILGWVMAVVALFIGIGCVAAGHGMVGIVVVLFSVGSGSLVYGGFPALAIGALGFVFLVLIALWLRKLIFPTS